MGGLRDDIQRDGRGGEREVRNSRSLVGAGEEIAIPVPAAAFRSAAILPVPRRHARREGLRPGACALFDQPGRPALSRRARLDPRQFSAHSLRSGFLTSAAESGASICKMADQSRHRSLDALRGCVPRVYLFKEPAGAAFP